MLLLQIMILETWGPPAFERQAVPNRECRSETLLPRDFFSAEHAHVSVALGRHPKQSPHTTSLNGIRQTPVLLRGKLTWLTIIKP